MVCKLAALHTGGRRPGQCSPAAGRSGVVQRHLCRAAPPAQVRASWPPPLRRRRPLESNTVNHAWKPLQQGHSRARVDLMHAWPLPAMALCHWRPAMPTPPHRMPAQLPKDTHMRGRRMEQAARARRTRPARRASAALHAAQAALRPKQSEEEGCVNLCSSTPEAKQPRAPRVACCAHLQLTP